MGLHSQITAQVRSVFKLLKSQGLGKEAQFVSKASPEFDFGDSETTTETPKEIAIVAVEIGKTKRSTTKNATSKQLVFETKDLPEITLFDTVTYEGHTWNIEPFIDQNDFITTITVSREVL